MINISGETRSVNEDIVNLLAYHLEMGEESCIIHHSEIQDEVWVLAKRNGSPPEINGYSDAHIHRSNI